MKIRSGFVSNSSSSSFIIRGVCVKKEDLVKLWNLDVDEDGWDCRESAIIEAIDDHMWNNKKGLRVHDTRYYFDGEPTDDVIVGVELDYCPDGAVIELKELDDGEVKDKLKEVGIEGDKISTFVQFISNDNY